MAPSHAVTLVRPVRGPFHFLHFVTFGLPEPRGGRPVEGNKCTREEGRIEGDSAAADPGDEAAGQGRKDRLIGELKA